MQTGGFRSAFLRGAFVLALICVGFGPARAFGAEEHVLAGSSQSLARAVMNLVTELSSAEPRIRPDDVRFSINLFRTHETRAPEGSIAYLLDHEGDRQAFLAELTRLEEILKRKIVVREQFVPHEELVDLTQEFSKAADAFAPLLIKSQGDFVREEHRFVGSRRMLFESITNKGNLIKAAMRFAMNTTLCAISLASSGEPVSQAVWLGVAAGGGSFMLMAGNDLYKAFLASPFWTKLPSQAYLEEMAVENRADPTQARYRELKITRMGAIKDLFIITGYLAYFQTMAVIIGGPPASWASEAVTFLIAVGLSLATETTYNLLNGNLTRRAQEKLDPADPATPGRIRLYKNRSSTGALIQSPVLTVFQILAVKGVLAAQITLVGFGAVGMAGYYMLLIAPPETFVGKLRDRVVMPVFVKTIERVENFVGALARRLFGGKCSAVAKAAGDP